jgi:hypothetical protein
VRRTDNLTILMCRLSSNLGASTYLNPQGLSRAVLGLLYLLYKNVNRYSAVSTKRQVKVGLPGHSGMGGPQYRTCYVPLLLASVTDVSRGFSENLYFNDANSY